MSDASHDTVLGIVTKFVRSYRIRPDGQSDADWLDERFAEYPELWNGTADRRACSADVVSGIRSFRTASDRLDAMLAAGGTRADFLHASIETGCKAAGVHQAGRYAAEIDRAVDEGSRLMAEQTFVRRLDGTLDLTRVNQAPTLNGNLAEGHHAATFNIDAAVKESPLRAEVPASHGRHSVDILVKDGDGSVVGRYQSKYGADAKATQDQFGVNYRGQRKLVPQGQAEDIPGATDRVESGGVQSRPLSKKEAVEMQRKSQETGKATEYDWSVADTSAICRRLGRKAAIAGALAVGFQGARILGRRTFNALAGRANRPVSEDLREFADSAAKSGAAAAGMTAVAGGLVVAAKKGLLGAALKSAKGNVIANVACAAVENLKVVAKVGRGEVTGKEALDLAGRTNCALVGSLAGAAKGAAAGASVGAALGPVGVAVGGFVGGVVGGLAGSVVGEAVYAGAKTVCKTACKAVSACARKVGQAVRGLTRALNPLHWF